MPISTAIVADTAELTALVNSAYRGESAKKGWTHESDILGGQRIDEEMMLVDLQKENAEILKYTNKQGTIIGCVYLEKKGSKLYVGMLTVSPDLQGSGIGKQLLAAAEERARQLSCDVLSMTVISQRHELIDWYQRHGYQLTGEILPFHADERFGIRKTPIELMVLEKPVE